MKHSLIFWILAFLITAGTAIYQRRTGPTYPIEGKILLGENEISYSLKTTHPGSTDHTISITTKNPEIQGWMEWKHYKLNEEWYKVEMHQNNGVLTARLPHQPPAGKLEYRVTLQRGGDSKILPENRPAIIRFRGDVPLALLILHVIAIFISMLLSTRAGLESLKKEPDLKKIIKWTIGFTFAGGFILGPLMQWYSFGVFWTGWPFGTDLTDNKTAVMLLVWIVAFYSLNRTRYDRYLAFTAAVVTLIVFLIPHSLLGSELDYSKVDPQKISMLFGR